MSNAVSNVVLRLPKWLQRNWAWKAFASRFKIRLRTRQDEHLASMYWCWSLAFRKYFHFRMQSEYLNSADVQCIVHCAVCCILCCRFCNFPWWFFQSNLNWMVPLLAIYNADENRIHPRFVPLIKIVHSLKHTRIRTLFVWAPDLFFSGHHVLCLKIQFRNETGIRVRVCVINRYSNIEYVCAWPKQRRISGSEGLARVKTIKMQITWLFENHWPNSILGIVQRSFFFAELPLESDRLD